jgi:predicted amidohydrolase
LTLDTLSLMSKKRVCVAAVQFAVTEDVAANLATCLRMIDRAAEHRPEVMVLPEFINHIAWYADAEHCYRVAVDLDGDFLAAIAAKAREHHCFIKVNVTLRRANGKVTGTNVLFGPDGARLAVNDKQILMGNENNFLERATENGPITLTPLGAVGMYACMDGVINEVTRGLAVRGAQLLLNSLNSFAHDEASLHIPVRAAENKVFVVAANKVGPLVPPRLTEAVAARLKIAPHYLEGAGESQIVAPDGTVLAKGPRTGEAVVVAEIDIAQAANKLRPDGTDILATRRPELYGPIAQPPANLERKAGAATMNAAVYQPIADGPEAVEEVAEAMAEAARAGVQLVVLPELFHLAGGRVETPADAVAQSRRMVATLQAALHAAAAECGLITTIADGAAGGFQHLGVLITRRGIVHRQPQLHRAGRHPWITSLGDRLLFTDVEWGRLAIVVGNDSIYPETFRLATLQNVEVVAVPTTLLERWEMATGLLERAAENRMNLVAASRPSEAGTSAVIAISPDFTLWTEWQRPFEGDINYPQVTRASALPGLTRADLHPAAAANRTISQKTNLVEGRPWQLAGPIASNQ